MENKIRSSLNDVYFSKTKQVVSELRSLDTAAELELRRKHMKNLQDALKDKKPSKDES